MSNSNSTISRVFISIRMTFPVVAMACFFANFAAVGLGDEMTKQTLLENYVEKVGTEHDDVTLALMEFKKAKFAEARANLDSAKKMDPKLPPSGILLARMFFAAKQPGIGKGELEKVAASVESEPEPYLFFGEFALAENRIADANLCYKNAVGLIESFEGNDYRKLIMQDRARKGLAAIAESRGEWGNAAKLLATVNGNTPHQPDVIGRLSRCLFKAGEIAEAEKLLEEAWRFDKEKIRRPQISMAVLYEGEGNKEKTSEFMNLAASEGISEPATQKVVATWALESGDITLADKCARRLLASSNSSKEARMLLALVARYQGDFEAAMKLLESVHLESPGHLGAMIELGIVLTSIKGEENRGLEFAQLATKLQPNLKLPAGRNAAVSLAWLLHRFKGQDNAEKILEQVLTNGQISIESRYYAARILIASKNNQALGKRMLKEVVDSDRIFPGYENAKKFHDAIQ